MGKESKKRSIVQPHLILCEGADEWNFLIRLLNHWIPEDAAFNTIQVIDFGGNDELKNFLESFNRFLIISLDVLICRYSPLLRAFSALFISEEPHKSFYYPSCFHSQK